MEAFETAILLEVKVLSQVSHLASKERNLKFFLGASPQFHQLQLLYYSWNQGQLCQNPFLNCSFCEGDGTEQQMLLQSSFQGRDGFNLRCSQGHGSIFLSYISQLFKATTVSSFSYTSKWLWSHLLTAHKLWHLLFTRKYIIFVWKNSVQQTSLVALLLQRFIKLHL